MFIHKPSLLNAIQVESSQSGTGNVPLFTKSAALHRTCSTFVQAGRTAATASGFSTFASVLLLSFSFPFLVIAQDKRFMFYCLVPKHHVQFSCCNSCLCGNEMTIREVTKTASKNKSTFLYALDKIRATQRCPCRSLLFIWQLSKLAGFEGSKSTQWLQAVKWLLDG